MSTNQISNSPPLSIAFPHRDNSRSPSKAFLFLSNELARFIEPVLTTRANKGQGLKSWKMVRLYGQVLLYSDVSPHYMTHEQTFPVEKSQNQWFAAVEWWTLRLCLRNLELIGNSIERIGAQYIRIDDWNIFWGLCCTLESGKNVFYSRPLHRLLSRHFFDDFLKSLPFRGVFAN